MHHVIEQRMKKLMKLQVGSAVLLPLLRLSRMSAAVYQADEIIWAW
jgi:hypothetical protein